MLPVSGAAQFSASGASCGLRPVSSASGAYCRLVRPGAVAGVGQEQVPQPAARASAFSSAMTSDAPRRRGLRVGDLLGVTGSAG